MGKDGLMGRLLGGTDKFTDKQVAETLTMLVTNGVKRGASDIHIEPHERFVLVRYRIDGALRGLHKLPRNSLVTLLAKLKTLADLNVQDVRTPQEGSYTLPVDGNTVEVGVATMPVYGGEKAVLHLSHGQHALTSLEELGFWGNGLSALQDVLTSPTGLVVVAGPRHSGLSSTLFSLLASLNTPMVNIATVEHHHKHHLPGVNQTYLGDSERLSVSEGLKAVLKQDPNIVMIASIPDSETALQAVHAATTGHLVLAGMHADNASQALLRLRAAGVEPFLLTTGLRASIGQRLVRKLCPACRQRYALDPDEQKELARSFGITTGGAYKKVHELEAQAAPAIFGDVKQLNSTSAQITHLWRAHPSGCEQCDHSGYQGRTAIVEVLAGTDALHTLLMKPDLTAVSALQAAAVKEGFVPMALDGLVKALRGQTTVSEVLRALPALA